MPACSFCGREVVVGKGMVFFKRDGTSLRFCSHKCERNHFMQRNPRKLKWTAKYAEQK